jgi:uncharacterized protein YbjT (DUF2867 family)
MDPASIAPAIEGADAVISAVGPRGTGPTTVIQDSVHSTIVSRADLAACLLAMLGDPATVHRHVAIAS